MSLTYLSILPSLYRIFRDRLFCRSILLLLASVALLPASSFGQFKFREPPNRQTPDALSGYDEQRIWLDFLSARYLGKFSLNGTLKYRPARKASTSYDFQLKGNWNSKEQLSELKLSRLNEPSFEKTVTIRDGEVFVLEKNGELIDEVPLKDDALTIPLTKGLPFTWTDLLMPYLKWKNVTYLGPDRYLGRPAHRFVLTNEDTIDTASKVIVTLDEDYAVLLKSDVLDKDDNVLKRIRVGGFKQFNDEWMFSELYWEQRQSRESVRLKVSDFILNP